MGIVIAHTAAVHEGANQAVNLGLEAMKRGKRVGFFLLSDGVFNAIRGSGDVAAGLGQAISGGGKVFLSEEHLLGAGIPGEKLIPGTETVKKAYEELVDLIMEDWDRVIIC
ncbi:MAG: DsrE family protein [Thermoplasmata archaeon]|nr:DsrE family protein [Thermoplasmata archaeon]